MKLVSGHPDDENAENAALAALRGGASPYSEEWPRETAYRFLQAISNGEAAARNAGPPSDKDLAAFVRNHAPSREHDASKVSDAILIFEVVYGAERVASEIVGHLERRADALWPITDEEDHLFTLLRGLAMVRDRMTHSDRSRVDARIRVLLAFHTKGTKVSEELEGILRRPESIVPPPMAAPSLESPGTPAEISGKPPAPAGGLEPEAAPKPTKKPAAKKKAAKKKSK